MIQNNLEVNLVDNFKWFIHRYVRAKDQNRPHLLQQVFCTDAILDMKVESENITFPAQTCGLAAISQLLVSDFSQSYENIYTYCIEESISITANRLSCQWLVIMSDRETGQLKVGTGDYLWTFSELAEGLNKTHKVQSLVIAIAHMLLLDPSQNPQILQLTETLAYSWCSRADVLALMEDIDDLKSICEAIDS